MTEYTGPERRSFGRLPVSLPISFSLFDTSESKKLTEIIYAHARNISAGGLLIETEQIPLQWVNALISGKVILNLRFKLPEFNDFIQSSAKVTWMARRKEVEQGVEPFVMGVNFTEISPEDQNRINTFVSDSADE